MTILTKWTWQKLLKAVAKALVLAGVVPIGGVFVYVLWQMQGDPGAFPIACKHFAAVVGLPGAAFASLWFVTFLEQTRGQIEIKIHWFEFKGASGPIILWVIGFLAITGAIAMLWGTDPDVATTCKPKCIAAAECSSSSTGK